MEKLGKVFVTAFKEALAVFAKGPTIKTIAEAAMKVAEAAVKKVPLG